MRLTKWQSNAIFEAVKAGGLDARECTFDYDDAGARITHVPSDLYFLLEGDPGHYMTTAFVGEEPDPPWSSDAFTWPTVEGRVETWSLKVKNDIDTPDLWAEIERAREILTGARYEDVENTQFTSDSGPRSRSSSASSRNSRRGSPRSLRRRCSPWSRSLTPSKRPPVGSVGRIRSSWSAE